MLRSATHQQSRRPVLNGGLRGWTSNAIPLHLKMSYTELILSIEDFNGRFRDIILVDCTLECTPRLRQRK
jgi:hypothetical protein